MAVDIDTVHTGCAPLGCAGGCASPGCAGATSGSHVGIAVGADGKVAMSDDGNLGVGEGGDKVGTVSNGML